MDISFSEQDLQFQEEIRTGLNGAEYPAHVKEKQEKGINFSKEDVIDFHKFLSSKGWMGYNWPVEYGGTGWSPVQIYLFLMMVFFLNILSRDQLLQLNLH